MSKPLIPEALLSQSKKILFVTHLAIGDFTYLQNYFKAFSEKYPHIKIDLWIDEVRRTRFFWDWKHLKKYSLFDWVKDSNIFNKIYFGTYSKSRFNKLLKQAKKEEYPIVVSLCQIRMNLYAKYARSMSPNGFIAGLLDSKRSRYLDTKLSPKPVGFDLHLSDIYKNWFENFFDISISYEKKEPFIKIPKKWIIYTKLRFMKWGIEKNGGHKVIFINIFAKNVSRCWPLDRLVKLIFSLQSSFEDSYIIVNVEPRFCEKVRVFFSNYCLNRVFLFTAKENFFQLPAMISLCDFVISVDTSVVHLASALKIPVVVLKRQKNPEWRPFYKDKSKVVCAPTKRGWVEDITLEQATCDINSFLKRG